MGDSYLIIVEVQGVNAVRLQPGCGPGRLVRSADPARHHQVAVARRGVARVGEQFRHGGRRRRFYPLSGIVISAV